MIYTFPCSRQSTQHERKGEMVSGHIGSGTLSSCSSLNYPAEGSSVQQRSSCKGPSELVRTAARKHQTFESRKESVRHISSHTDEWKDTDLPLSLPTPQTRMLPIGWAWSRVWPRGSIRFMVSFSRTISMSLPCRDAQCQRKQLSIV